MKSADKVPPTKTRKPVPNGAPSSHLLNQDSDPPRGTVTIGRNLKDGFRELEREGIFCQYTIRNQILRNNYRTERDTRGILYLYKRNGGSDRYETTLDRVCPKEQLNLADTSGVHLPFPELSERWIEEFAAEVVLFLERISEGATDEIPAKLRALVVALDTCEPLNLGIIGRNNETIRLMKEHKENLLQRLDEIAQDWPIDPPSSVQGQRVEWNDTASLLAYLLTELIEAEYIIPPSIGKKTGKEGNRAAVADLAYQLLDIRDRSTGELVTREYFRSLMRPSSPDRDSRVDLFRIRPRVARNRPT